MNLYSHLSLVVRSCVESVLRRFADDVSLNFPLKSFYPGVVQTLLDTAI
jgi:hypothetical protein